MRRYIDLVRAYLRDGEEAHVAAIGALRDSLAASDVPIEDLVGLHERAMLDLRDVVATLGYDIVVAKTTECLTELLLAHSLADQKKKDVREREQRMERERQRLEALGQMVGGVAHEFNNLLQPILGMAELALEDAEPGSELAEQLMVIQTCAGQAAGIVRGILTTARKQGPPPQRMPFAALLKKTVRFVGAIVPPSVMLDLAIGCGDERVLCEEAELAQVVLNLVRNSADAMDGKGTIRIGLSRKAEALHLVIADDGHGMPPDVAARAFQPFFTTKAPTQGTGLGLSIVMAIVHGWNATLTIDSAPGAGTRMAIVLPVEA